MPSPSAKHGTPETIDSSAGGCSTGHPSEVREDLRPLSFFERWMLGLALAVASTIISVVEHLPRVDHFNFRRPPLHFVIVASARDTDRHVPTVELQIVDLRREAPRRDDVSPR